MWLISSNVRPINFQEGMVFFCEFVNFQEFFCYWFPESLYCAKIWENNLYIFIWQSLYTCILKSIRCTWQPKTVILWSIFYAVTYWNDCVFYCVEFDVWCRLVFVSSCVCFLSHLLLMWSIYYWKCFITISTFILRMSASPFCSASTWRPIKEKLWYWIDHQIVPSLGKTEKLKVLPNLYAFVSGERASGASNTPAESGLRQAKYRGVLFNSLYLSQNKLSVNH